MRCAICNRSVTQLKHARIDEDELVYDDPMTGKPICYECDAIVHDVVLEQEIKDLAKDAKQMEVGIQKVHNTQGT